MEPNLPMPWHRAVFHRIRATAASVWHLTRTAPDPWLHPWRRRRAVGRIARVRPRSVLMVCLGNICRSPYAATRLSSRLNGQTVRVSSGGFIGPDRRSPDHAQAAAAALGVDLSAHRSRVVTNEILNAHDLVVVMEPSQRSTLSRQHGVPADRILVLGDLDPEPIQSRIIADPYGKSEATFLECYRRIDRCIDTLRGALPVRH